MPGYSAEPTRPDKVKAFAGIIVVYAMIVGAALMMPSNSPLRIGESTPTVLIDVKEMPEPPPPPTRRCPERPRKKKARRAKRPSRRPVVAPKPRIRLRA